MKSKSPCILVILSVFIGITSNLLACTYAPDASIESVQTPDGLTVHTDSNGDCYVAVGQTVQFNCSASDDDGDPMTYILDYESGTDDDDDGSVPVEAAFSETHSFSAVGSYTVTLTVTDSTYMTGYDSVTVHVGPSRVKREIAGTNPTDVIWYSYIQHAIDKAGNGDTITANEGVYVENIDFDGKNITVKSTDPADSGVVERTVIVGNGLDATVTFKGTEGKNSQECKLIGFTITSGSTDEGLVGYWKLDESNGETTAADSMDNYNGTIVDSPSWQDDDGHIKGALQLDGINDYIDCGTWDIDDFGGTNGTVTIAAWVKTDTNNTYNLITTCIGGANYFSAGTSWSNQLRVQARDVVNSQFCYYMSNGTITPGVWTHVVCTLEAGVGCKLYIDGVLDSEHPDSNLGLYSFSSNAYVGHGYDSTNGFFGGGLDDVRIYNRALGESEIAYMFAQNRTVPIAHWTFDENGADSSGNSNVATLQPEGTHQLISDTDYHIGTGSLELAGDPEDDGLGDYATANGIIDDVAGKSFTLMTWVKSGLSTGQEIFAAFNTSGGGNRLLIGQSANNANLMLYDPSGGYYNYTNKLVFDNQWHHVVYMLDTIHQKAYVYVDGDIENIYSYDTTCSVVSGDTFSIGQEFDGLSYTDHFAGNIDDMRIFNRRLAPIEIKNIYEMDKPWFNGGGINGNSNNETTGTSAKISKCVITDNKAEYGGGIYDCDGEISNCTITNNEAGADGGGLAKCDGTIVNCVIAGNTANEGGGLINSNVGLIINCTIVDNIANGTGGIKDSSSYILNSIIWGNGDDLDGAKADYSCIEDNDGGSNNIFLDPKFVAGDPLYHIRWDSPCIDRGDLTWDYSGYLDIDGESRYDVPRVDIGADEIPDLDSDGMLDTWEAFYGLDDPYGNNDNDAAGEGAYTLTNLEEFVLGTNPNVVDTDGDGLSDGWENEYGLDPTDSDNGDDADDLDGDGVSNYNEFTLGTDPLQNDKQGLVIEYSYVDNGNGYLSNQVEIETVKNGSEETISKTEYKYDELGRKKKEQHWKDVNTHVPADDAVSLYTYDVRGNLLLTAHKAANFAINDDTIELAGGDIVTENIYDIHGRIDFVKSPNCVREQGSYGTDYVYNDGGELEYVKAPFDPAVTDSGEVKTINEYEQNTGRLKKVTDGRGDYTEFVYDSLGRIVKETAFNSSGVAKMQTRFGYDGMSNVTRSAVMANASTPDSEPINENVDKVTDSYYDNPSYPGRLSRTQMYYGGSPALTAEAFYDYDGLGRLEKTTDPAGNTVELVYDSMDRVEKRTESRVVNKAYSSAYSNLIGHWTLDEDNASTEVPDSSGNGNTGTAQRTTDLMNSLVGHWKMNDTDDDSIVNESSANAYNGIFNNSQHTSGQSAPSNRSGTDKALLFDGIDDWITVTDASCPGLPRGLQDQTIAFWVRITDLATSGKPMSFFRKGGTEGLIFFYLMKDTNQLELLTYWPSVGLGSSGLLKTTSSEVIVRDDWYHIAGTFDRDGKQKLYVNGVFQSESDISLAANIPWKDDDMYFGRISATGGNYDHLEGAMDDVRIYNKVLTATEINELYNSGSGTEEQFVDDGKIGGALAFNGISDSIRVDHSSTIDMGVSNFSIAFWMKSTSRAQERIICKRQSDGAGYDVYFDSSSTSPSLFMGGAAGSNAITDFNGPTDVRDGLWHHIVIVADIETGAKLYVDGSSLNEGSTLDISAAGSVDNSSDLFIARYSVVAADYFTGQLDDVRIYKEALTQDDVQQLYDPSNSGGSQPQPEIVSTTEYTYDRLGRVWKQTEKPDLADSSKWQTAFINYDAVGNVLASVAPDGVLTKSYYNGLAQLTQQVRDAATGGIAQTTDYAYYRTGPLYTVTSSPDGTTLQTTTYDYYPDGQLNSVTYPDSKQEIYDYYVNGNLKTKTNKNGWTTVHVYDDSENVITKNITEPGETTVSVVESFTYDGLNRLLTANKTEDSSQISNTAFTYTGFSHIETSDSYFGQSAKTVKYDYDQAGNLIKTIYPDSTVIVRTPTWDGQINTLSSSSTDLVSYDYIGGSVSGRNYPVIGVSQSSVYDNLGRLKSLSAKQGASDITSFTYGYSAKSSNIESILSNNRSELPQNRYEYDALDRVTRADYGSDSYYEIFVMDILGNRSMVELFGEYDIDYTSAGVDLLSNRYTTVDSLSCVYDDAGNLVLHPFNGVNYIYTYDHENRILMIEKNATFDDVATFTYDALGRRIRMVDSISGNTTQYYYNAGWQVLCEYDGSGNWQRRFVYGNYIDEVLLLSDTAGDHYYVHDHLYSPVALLDDSGSVTERYEYDAYGYLTILDDLYNPVSGSAAANPYYFTGRRLDVMDADTFELMHYRNRTYDPQTGRFLQPDPLGYIDGMNLYEYVGSNPVINLDPMGLFIGNRQREDLNSGVARLKVKHRRVVNAINDLGIMAQNGNSSEEQLYAQADKIQRLYDDYRKFGNMVSERVGDFKNSLPFGAWGKNADAIKEAYKVLSDHVLKPDLSTSKDILRENIEICGKNCDAASGLVNRTKGLYNSARVAETGLTVAGAAGGIGVLGKEAAKLGWKKGAAYVAKQAVAIVATQAAVTYGVNKAQEMGASEMQLRAGLAALQALSMHKAFTKPKPNTNCTKVLPKPKSNKHHIFNKFRGKSPNSQKYRDFFKKHGIDVDDYTVEIPESVHVESIHKAGNNWTTKWKKWIDTNPNASTKDVYQQAGKMMDEFGLSKYPIKPYKK